MYGGCGWSPLPGAEPDQEGHDQQSEQRWNEQPPVEGPAARVPACGAMRLAAACTGLSVAHDRLIGDSARLKLTARRDDEALLLLGIQLQRTSQELDGATVRRSENATLQLADFLRVQASALSQLLLGQAHRPAVTAQKGAE